MMRGFRRGGAAGRRALMTGPLISQISHELLAMLGKPYRHVQAPVWNARVRSGDLLSRGARQQLDARGRRVRGTRQLFGVNPLAWYLPSSLCILESLNFLGCPIMDTVGRSDLPDYRSARRRGRFARAFRQYSRWKSTVFFSTVRNETAWLLF
jgi:hypothetical protein